MMKPSPYALKPYEIPASPRPSADSDADKTDLAGTRMLIAEESFDALVQLMIDAGLVSKGCAAVMLDRLSEKMLVHAGGKSGSHWPTRPTALLDQAARLAAKAAMLRTATVGLS